MKKILALLILLTLVVSVFAACKKDEKPADDNQPPVTDTPSEEQGPTLEDAKALVRDLYKNKPTITAGDFDVVASVMANGVKFTVTWTTDSTDVVIAESTKENAYLVDIVPTEPDADINYVLTATITATDGSTITTTFNYTVPKFQVNTYAEYVAAEADAPLVVEGVVYGIMSKAAGDQENSVFVQDLNGGGYYVYALTDDPSETGIEIGYTVRVKGVKAVYNGTPEIKNASVEIRSTEKVTVTPVDLTETFVTASNAANENLLAHLGEYVVIKGVTVLEAGSNGYYYFELDGVKTYLRISSSSNCTTAEQETTIKTNHAAKFYFTADVAGIASIYKGNFYIMPVDDKAFDNFSAEQQLLPDDVKANMVKDALTLPAEFATATPYTLPLAGAGANFSDVAIAWALAETTNATLVEGVLTPVIPAEGSVNITLTATITKNNASVTKEFTIAVKALEATSLTEATEIATTAGTSYTTDKYLIEGTIVRFNDQQNALIYGNIYIADENGNEFYVYGIYTADGVTKYGDMTGDKPQVGDKVSLYGVLGMYGTTVQMKSGWLLSWEHVYTKTTTNATCKDDGAHTYTCACGHTYSETIPAGEHNYVDGVCSACGVANHEHTLVAGTVVPNTCTTDGYTTYTCSGCTYTENKDETTKTGHNYVSGVCTNEGCGVVDPNYYFPMSFTEALAAADNTKVEITVTVIKIDTAYNSNFDNITVSITDGTANSIQAYRLKGNWAVGDILTIKGSMATYNGNRQLAAGATAVKVGTHECTDFTEATCEDAAVCKLCGKANGEALGHTAANAEGNCDRCGTNLEAAASQITASKTIAQCITEYGWTGSTTKQTFNLDDNVTVKINGGSNTGKAYNGDHIRIYATDTPAGTITISVAEGYELVSVKVTCQTGTYAFLQVNGGNGADISNVETAVSGSSVQLNSVKNGSDGKQVRVTAIEVVYAPAN